MHVSLNSIDDEILNLLLKLKSDTKDISISNLYVSSIQDQKYLYLDMNCSTLNVEVSRCKDSSNNLITTYLNGPPLFCLNTDPSRVHDKDIMYRI